MGSPEILPRGWRDRFRTEQAYDMDEHSPEQPYEPDWQTKRDVARRQIVEAIRMFFERRDSTATHTVISAAHQILTDLARRSDTPSLLRLDGKGNTVNFGSNFLKHADKDPEGRINVEPLPALNAEFLMDAVGMLQNITGDLPVAAKFYFSWFITKHEDLFENIPPDMVPRLNDETIDPDDFEAIAEFLRYESILGEDFEKAVHVAVEIRRVLGLDATTPSSLQPELQGDTKDRKVGRTEPEDNQIEPGDGIL